MTLDCEGLKGPISKLKPDCKGLGEAALRPEQAHLPSLQEEEVDAAMTHLGFKKGPKKFQYEKNNIVVSIALDLDQKTKPPSLVMSTIFRGYELRVVEKYLCIPGQTVLDLLRNLKNDLLKTMEAVLDEEVDFWRRITAAQRAALEATFRDF